MKVKQLLGVAAVALACGAVGAAWATSVAAADDVPAATMTEAEGIFKTRCSTCHGPTGKGDGPASAGLNPKPRDMSDAAWQKSVTDDAIEKIIKSGGPAVGKSPLMPGNPDLANKPEVIKALRIIVRNQGKAS
ncbi:c-type cytochrome [Candidatus Binatia bacterium]|nr:c-type cytochrome [Candidatus Binatia bacterium]